MRRTITDKLRIADWQILQKQALHLRIAQSIDLGQNRLERKNGQPNQNQQVLGTSGSFGPDRRSGEADHWGGI